MKDLKQEYEQMILPEIPDLWDRIEAALPLEEESSPSTELPTPAASIPMKPNKKASIYKWASVAAAFLCAFLAIPMALKDVHGCGGSYSETASIEMDVADAMAENIMENAPMDADPEAPMAAAQAVPMDGAPMEMVPEASMDNAEAAAEEAASLEEDHINRQYTEEMKATGGDFFVYEVLIQIVQPITENNTLMGYQVEILKNTDHSYPNGVVEVYFPEDFETSDMEILENMEQHYQMHLIFNEENARYEIVNISILN